jgi:hypothetical protein
MTTVARFDGDLRVTGNLQVDGTMPTYSRSELAQDAAREFTVPFTDLRVWDALATNLPATSGTDDLGLYGGTFGSATPKVSTGDVKNTSVTRYARFTFQIPAEYDAGETIAVRLVAGMKTTVASTSATLDVECYKSDEAAGVGSDLCTTAAQSINSTSFGDKDFQITPTGLTAGDILDIRLTIAVVDSATATAVEAAIGSIQVLCDIKG